MFKVWSQISYTNIDRENPSDLPALSPTVGRVWGNVSVLGSPFKVHVRPCESLANRPLPWESYGLLKISASDFDTVSMCRRFRAYAYEFLTMVSEGVVHGVHKVVIRLSFGVIR